MTTLAGGPDEVNFISGMERQEPKSETIAINAANTLLDRVRDMFREDGRIAHAMRTLEHLLGLAKPVMAGERGPDPDAPVDDDDLARIVRIVAKYGGSRHEYHEAPRGDDNGVKTIILGVGATLLCAFVGGGWILSNRVAALEARVTEWQVAVNQRQNAADQRIERLENRRP